MEEEKKYKTLVESLKATGGAVVAFSGGVDSALLLCAAVEALGERALAVTGRSATYTDREYEEARKTAAALGARHRAVETCELENPDFRKNPPERCYYCKSELFSVLKTIADREGFSTVVEGSNLDDRDDWRPGGKAAAELGVRSPLAEAGLAKAEIRALARAKGLSVWNKPSLACLSSRVPYGEEITEERLERIGRAEEAVRAHGFAQLRVRDHGTLARVEVGREDMGRFFHNNLGDIVTRELKEIGYRYVTLDLEGYRTGAMNEVLPDGGDSGD